MGLLDHSLQTCNGPRRSGWDRSPLARCPTGKVLARGGSRLLSTWPLSPEGGWEVAHCRGYTLTEGGEAGWLGAGGVPSLRQLPGQDGGPHMVQ